MNRFFLLCSLAALAACAQTAPPPPPPAPPSAPAPPPQQSFKIYFDEGGANLTLDGRQIVEAAAATIKADPPGTPVQIMGYTDTRGSAALNQRLSQRRAQNVASQLVQDGVSQSQISVKAEGEQDQQATPAQSRRVEIAVGGGGAAPPPPPPPGAPPAPGS